MRQQIDCAVLKLSAHSHWLPAALESVACGLNRIRMHELDWELMGPERSQDGSSIGLPVYAFAQASVSLRRYDLCIVPVSLDTLGWTRQALAAIPRGPFVPLLGVFNGLKSAAMQDLLELGLADFVRQPLCAEEFRARILAIVARMPRPGVLREPDHAGVQPWVHAALSRQLPALVTPAQVLAPRAAGRSVTLPSTSSTLRAGRGVTRQAVGQTSLRVQHAGPVQAPAYGGRREPPVVPESFRSAKCQIVDEFERQYITGALARHQGNIAMAARASSKHRRAFWALMRKHLIDAEQFRSDDCAE